MNDKCQSNYELLEIPKNLIIVDPRFWQRNYSSINAWISCRYQTRRAYCMLLTTFTLSLAAKATMSAQETMPGQASSSFFLASSMTSKPRRVKFGIAVFSGCGLLAVGCRRTEPSHPCKPAAMIKFSKTTQLVVATANLSQQLCQRSQIWRT